MNEPKISVIIPVYNAQKYIRKCLGSILKQHFPLEVICVDDCSTDSTPEILKEYAEKYSNVTVLRNEKNMYAGPSRNRGLEIAKGEYVHFMDSDDFVAPGSYAYMYKKAKKNYLDMLKTRCVAINEKTGFPIKKQYRFPRFKKELYNTVLDFHNRPEDLYCINVVPWNGIYRREFLLENNIRFNDLFCANDRSFYVNVCIIAKRVMITRRTFVFHRKNIGDSLVGKRATHFDCDLESFKICENMCNDNNVNDKVRFEILEHELRNVFGWYKIFNDKKTVSPAHKQAINELFSDSRRSYFDSYGEKSKWSVFKKLI
ncbi:MULTISPECIES: glycosyltransferase family 2 protein [unclassified Butyrivibrio]|uniref:glycosyltransferase family 2 protein n=1 Tax=unclassified Butyrivibrio TaxID=2639466 RepID=UPI000A53F43A|nr:MULTISPECIES: glycosyltransferase family 2 protein [unclassified Butyrivibrio]